MIGWLSDAVQEATTGIADEPALKVIAAEPERTSTRSSVENRLAPPDMTEQHACPGAPESFWRLKPDVTSNDWSR